MSKIQNWLMIDMHTHSQFSSIRKDGENVKNMSANDYVETLYKYGIKIFSITDHNYFSNSYYDDVDKYISSKQYDIKIINGVELDVYVDVPNDANAFIHICFYFDNVDRKSLHDSIDNLYADSNSKPNFTTILKELSQLNCKFVAVPHGDKDRGLLNHYLIDKIVSSDRKEFYKYAMYKIFNAFDIRPASINDSENHWALNFYEKTQAFKELVEGKSEDDINTIRNHIIEYLKEHNAILTDEEKAIFEYAKQYGSYYAYFAFSDWHNGVSYNPQINNFIFGCTDYAFSAFELATLDPVSRIEKTTDKEIEISDSLLESVSFKIGGNEKKILFSPGLNAIVGKRGSGKSLLVSVIRNLVKSDDDNGAIAKYKRLKISDISCTNRGGINLSMGRLGSTEFLKQDEIRDVIDNPQNAQDKIKNKFPTIKEIDLSQVEKIADLCDQISPLENDYKSITSELASAKTDNQYLFKTIDLIDSSIIESDFSNAVSKLEDAKQKLEENSINTNKIVDIINKTKEIAKHYLLQIEMINDIFSQHNKRITEFNKQLSVNQDNARRNANNINFAFNLIDRNFNKALAFKILKQKLSSFSLKAQPASIYIEGKYLFATYYNLENNSKAAIANSITNCLTYATDQMELEVKKYLKGDEKRKLKSNFSSLGSGVRNLINSDYFKSKQSFYEITNSSIDYKAVIKTNDNLKEQVENGNLIDLNSASLGVKSVAYLNMLFDLENKILVFDQPEDNIDNDYISNHLVPIIKSNKKIKQLIFVTHNPSVAVYGDAFNYIYTENDGDITYKNFFIENVEDKEQLLKILEGGRSSFSNRNKKYGDVLGDENYGN